ncbi:MAG TPA: hypothetical protein VNZ64_18370 [Candidatus Acidoferrum sp.]|jgi:hypothetical protein|nr:hypothetical protein [Candidatus Acidoferrum sp.]
MKKCTWCGKEYPDDAEVCAIDGEALKGNEPQERPVERRPGGADGMLNVLEEVSGPVRRVQASELDPDWRPEVIDVSGLKDAFVFAEGYSRPNWKLIRSAIKQTVPLEKLSEAWTEAATQWVRQVGADLGGEYKVRRSAEFILLSALEPAAAEGLLLFAERTLGRIYAALRDAAWQWGHGKHVVLLFTEDDDYYQYVSYYNADGIHPASGGCLIHKDYVHIAMPYLDGRSVRQSLTHELLHNSVVHLRLPLWLNEGLAMVFDWTVDQWRRQFLDHDLRDRHLMLWNAENIQKFWSGVSFGEPGDSNQLSYSLAEIMVHLLLTEAKEFVAFLKLADWRDAGQTAALDVLGIDLGKTMATFLGEGNWRPNRKAMAECWKDARREEQKAG